MHSAGAPSSAGSGGSGAGGGQPAFWTPTPGSSWQAQLSGEIDPALDVDFFYLDADNLSDQARAELSSAGKHIACYLSAGSFEPWRDDADQFPESALGNPLEGYPDELWIDIRDDSVRALLTARIDRFADAGCDSVLPANLEAYQADSGFALTREDERDFALFLSSEIHARAMSAGLSISAELIPEVMAAFDWALVIDCLSSGACTAYQPLRAAGKAVLLIEFGDESDVDAVCPAAAELGFDALIKDQGLGAFRVPCPG